MAKTFIFAYVIVMVLVAPYTESFLSMVSKATRSRASVWNSVIEYIGSDFRSFDERRLCHCFAMCLLYEQLFRREMNKRSFGGG